MGYETEHKLQVILQEMAQHIQDNLEYYENDICNRSCSIKQNDCIECIIKYFEVKTQGLY